MNNKNERKFYIPPEGPPTCPPPNKEIYHLMGEQNIYKMMFDVYKNLSQSKIKHFFPKDLKKLKESSEKSASFFIQLCGGPPKYENLYGPPQMRRRHLLFKINKEDKNEWLKCFMTVLKNASKEYNFPVKYLDNFKKFLNDFANWMVNSKN